jgi:hypothetical protein
MKLSRGGALVLALLTLMQVGYIGFFFLTVLRGLAPDVPVAERTDTLIMQRFFRLGVFHISFAAISACITVFYIYLIMKERRVTENGRPFWILVVIMGNAIGELAYWYAYVWNSPAEREGRDGGGEGRSES